MYFDILQKLHAANVSGDSELVQRWELQKILEDDVYKELCTSGLFSKDTVSLVDIAFYLSAENQNEEEFFFKEMD